MDSCPTSEALLKRLEVLERRQRQRARWAMVFAAVGLLAFVGWAPFDDVRPSSKQPAQVPPTAAPAATAQPEPATTATGPESTPAPSEPTPSISEVIADEEEPQSVLSEPQSDFQSYTHREGDETYLPTRLEWISLRASAELPRGGGANDGYGIMYGPDGKGSNTIRVVCSYDSKRVNRQRMEEDLKYIQVQMAGLAELYGWNWLKVRIETRAVN